MKNRFLILAMAGLLSGTLYTACNNSEKRVEEAAEDVADAQKKLDDAEAKFAEEWENFKMENEKRIQENETEISNYREMEKADPTWSNKYRVRIDELETRNNALRDKIRNYEAEKRRDKWESFKEEFKHDMDELGTALKDFARDNKK
jgi:phosphoenolpyruvate-protein kinase (PTS system EI component)